MHYYKLKSSEHRSAEFDSASPTNSSLRSCQVTGNSCQGKHPKAPEVCTVVPQICPKTAYHPLRSTTNAVAILYIYFFFTVCQSKIWNHTGTFFCCIFFLLLVLPAEKVSTFCVPFRNSCNVSQNWWVWICFAAVMKDMMQHAVLTGLDCFGFTVYLHLSLEQTPLTAQIP